MQVLEATHRTIPEIRSFSSAILNGVEMPVLKPAPLPFDPPVMLCIGRLSPEKGFDLAVEAFSGVADRYPSARMVLAGDGPDRMALEQRTERLGLAERVMFRGMIPPGRVAEILNEATVVVVPSRREGLGLSAVEAALMARPVVAAEIGGLPEVVLDGRTGLLVRPEDPTSIARAVISLLDDPRRATELGDAARRRALHRFTLARCVDDYDGIYHRLAAASRGGPRVGTEDAIQFTVKS
ncbi:MAG: glycosyltransferase family 4 protein [Gemmatimonadetes bacterium]|nr:glycosyltransferase family 4 protein [Gemmatimonadota bacterium]